MTGISRRTEVPTSQNPRSLPPATPTESKADSKPAVRKLSYNEKRELAELPERIEMLETEQHQFGRQDGNPCFLSARRAVITQAVNRLQELHEELSRLYQRWGQLES